MNRFVVSVVLALILTGCTMGGQQTPEAPSPDQSGETPTGTQDNVVTYSSSGFAPQTITIQQGETVTWQAEDSAPAMWVASDRHPVHSQYDGTSLQEHCGGGSTTFDACQAADTYSFTFEKAGTWDYHNHRLAGHGGTVIVEEN